MKKSLVAAALLSLFVAACGGQKERSTPKPHIRLKVQKV